ncbi:uncharacterized protein [Paramormyrops kingsleyae]|uniref:uncharacterized protein isoform X1 n=1 Tax=Paramormyrops kingsleyae TaxID=1676925 RepID=UPI000CD61473|nr:uncharacterized protein LOC111836296 isoform X1 [Paramormyrops kingsleyae]
MMILVFLLGVFSWNFSLAVWNEEKHIVCSGKDFNLPIKSRVRVVMFIPSSPPGPTRVVLDHNKVMDPRYGWTGEKILQVKEVTGKDQGLFKLKMSSGFVYKKIYLTVVDCIKSVRRFYGDDLKIHISSGGALMEFSPKSSQSLSQPTTLWNSSIPSKSQQSRGSVKAGHWILEGLTQADQGNYTLRDVNRQLLSTVHLIVEEHGFSFTYFTGDSLILPLFLPYSKTHLSFIPSYSSSSYVSITDRPAVLLVRGGEVVATAERYRWQLMPARVGQSDEIVIEQLRLDNTGVYEVRDTEGNLVSSTWLEVVKKPKWRANFKSVAAPLCGLGFMAVIVLLKKKYPSWSRPSRNTQRNASVTPFGAHLYSETYSYPFTPQFPSHPLWDGAQNSGNCVSPMADITPAAKTACTPSTETEPLVDRAQTDPANNILQTRGMEGERKASITFPLSSDCLRSSEPYVQFQIKKTGKFTHGKEYLSLLPLSTNTSDCCSVYTSDKLSFS